MTVLVTPSVPNHRGVKKYMAKAFWVSEVIHWCCVTGTHEGDWSGAKSNNIGLKCFRISVKLPVPVRHGGSD